MISRDSHDTLGKGVAHDTLILSKFATFNLRQLILFICKVFGLRVQLLLNFYLVLVSLTVFILNLCSRIYLRVICISLGSLQVMDAFIRCSLCLISSQRILISRHMEPVQILRMNSVQICGLYWQQNTQLSLLLILNWIRVLTTESVWVGFISTTQALRVLDPVILFQVLNISDVGLGERSLND